MNDLRLTCLRLEWRKLIAAGLSKVAPVDFNCARIMSLPIPFSPQTHIFCVRPPSISSLNAG